MRDGSTFSVTRSGKLGLRMRTGYVGLVSGSVRASYTVAGRKRAWSCTIRTARIGTINKRARRSVGNWFPKRLLTVPNKCRLPADLLAVLPSQKVQLVGRVRFVKQWPTTGRAVNPETGMRIPTGIRVLRITVGR